MKHTIREINISEIHDSNTYNIHPFLSEKPCTGSLLDSIRRTGIINPPALIDLENSSYDVIYGRQRLKSIGAHDNVYCKILPLSSSPEHILSLILEDQFVQQSLSYIEQSYFLKLCHSLIPEKSRRQKYLSNLPANRITKGHKFLRPFSNLSAEIQRSVYEGTISEKALAGFIGFSSQEQDILLHLLIHLQLGGNNQKKAILFLFEISRKEDITLEELLNLQIITDIINKKDLTIAQKSTQFFQLLYTMSHPRLSAAQSDFDKRVKQLNLPDNTRITASPYFEKDDVTLSITFKNLDELQRVWQNLSDELENTLS